MLSLKDDSPGLIPDTTTTKTEAKAPKRCKVKWRKPRKVEDIRIRRAPAVTYVSAQDGTDIIFDPGDYETKVAPIYPFLNCNRSGDGATHVRIWGSIEPGKRKNNLQVSRLVMGLAPNDRREVFFTNRNQRDMRKTNLELRGPVPMRDDTNEEGGDSNA